MWTAMNDDDVSDRQTDQPADRAADQTNQCKHMLCSNWQTESSYYIGFEQFFEFPTVFNLI